MLFSPIIPVITFALQTVFEYATLTKRRSILEHVLVRVLALCAALGSFFLMRRLGIRTVSLYYLCTIPVFIPCAVLFTETVAQKVFFCFTSWGVTTFLSSVCNYLAVWVTHGRAAYPLRYVLYASVSALVIAFYCRFIRVGYRKLLSYLAKGNPAFAAFPVLAFVLLSLIFTPFETALTPVKFLEMLLFEGYTIFSYYLMASHFTAIHNRSQYETRLENAERIVSLQKKYYTEMEKGIVAQGKLMHDTRHQYVVLSTLAQSGDYATLGEYLDRLLGEGFVASQKRYCANPVANAVIGGYIEIADSKGIAVSTDIDLPADIRIDEYELCALLGNAIENAIEACQRIPPESERYPGRRIDIKARGETSRLVIRIENSFQPLPEDRDGYFPSSKGARSGIGLERMRAIVEKYRGALNCER
ncbi:MAG TPA: GHKL domain-containing protein, partial [Treponemataceae bacterium]|nr:GHKL domain-containing protein [Treponemataceae bacterium]